MTSPLPMIENLRDTECCLYMQSHVDFECPTHKAYRCPDQVIVKANSMYVIPVYDGGNSFFPITYCPFCGTKIGEDQENEGPEPD